MPRRRKPAGYEKWTWAEIEAGHRFSKAQKRWNHAAKKSGWEQRPDGSYVMPAVLVPLFVVMLIAMIAIGAVAPKGIAYTKGDNGAIGAMILVGLCAFALIYLGIVAATANTSTPRDPAATREEQKRRDGEALRTALSWIGRAVFALVLFIPVMAFTAVKNACIALSARLRALPDWAQASLIGLGIAVPVVTALAYAFGR